MRQGEPGVLLPQIDPGIETSSYGILITDMGTLELFLMEKIPKSKMSGVEKVHSRRSSSLIEAEVRP